MFKYFFAGALLIGLGICGATELRAQRKLEATEKLIAEKRAEVQKLGPIVDEVDEYQRSKDDLQRRIDVINRRKQNQVGPARAIEEVATIDTKDVDSIAIAGATLVVNRVKR